MKDEVPEMTSDQVLKWMRRRYASVHYVEKRKGGEWLVGFNIPIGRYCYHHVTGRNENIALAIKEAEEEAEACRIERAKIKADRKANPPDEIIMISSLKRRRRRRE